jgi:TPR repeat protein
MYRKGQGVPQDDKTAVKWYRLAAEQGYALAQFSLEILERHIAQQKPSPTVTPPVIARESPPPSPSAADKEN